MAELQVDQDFERNPWTSADVDAVKDRFSFVVISDRTGLAQPGVFQRGLAVTDLLAPSFAVQVGDMIEAYVTDAEELETQWSEIDEMLSELSTPLFHVPGNHDVSNDVQRDKWLERYGRLYYHFRLGQYLFLVIDTQDPPENFGDDLIGAMHEVNRLMQLDPARLRPTVTSVLDWEGTQPASVTDEQLTYFDRVLAAHEDVQWIFLFMHMPLWRGSTPPGPVCGPRSGIGPTARSLGMSTTTKRPWTDLRPRSDLVQPVGCGFSKALRVTSTT